MVSVKKYSKVIYAIAVILVITAIAVLIYKDSQRMEKKAEKISVKELEESISVLERSGMPESVIDELTESQRHYIAVNLDENAVFEAKETGMAGPAYLKKSGNDGKLEVTAIKYGTASDSEAEAQLFIMFRCPEEGWGINGDSFSVSMGSGWVCMPGNGESNDGILTVYLESQKDVKNVVAYHCTYSETGESGDTIGYQYTIPIDVLKGIPGSSYVCGVTAHLVKENPEARDFMALYFSYKHDDNVVYADGLAFSDR